MHLSTGVSSSTSIAFFCCTNGYGHYKRVLEIASQLTSTHRVTIFCNREQVDKIGLNKEITYVFYTLNNIRWDKVLSGRESEMIKEYFQWLTKYGPEVNNYDIAISDNIVGLLNYRDDIILQGSFLWKDVLSSKIGENDISSHDEVLIRSYNPTIITNKYVETQSVKSYPNRVQYGFGFENRRLLSGEISINLTNYSSLKYLPSYSNFINRVKVENNLAFVDNFSYLDNVRMFARPGVGTITHCLENSIPLVALYDDNDSHEIVELAQVVEDLDIGFMQNVNEPLSTAKLDLLNSNTVIVNSEKVEIGAYKKIAEYIKNI